MLDLYSRTRSSSRNTPPYMQKHKKNQGRPALPERAGPFSRRETGAAPAPTCRFDARQAI